MTEYPITPRTRIQQIGGRARYDRDTIYQIVDRAPLCHVGFAIAKQPYVIPTLHAREGDTLFLHGSPGSRLVQHVGAGHPVCVSFALLDGWVLGKAACSHSVNYRSVVLFGSGHLVELPEHKMCALKLLSEHMVPGRWQEVRPPNDRELHRTAIVAIEIEHASAKVRVGPPQDTQVDREIDTWSGVVPLRTSPGRPVAAPDDPLAHPLSPSIRAYLLSSGEA
jgi:nitroimidazol reductase NimA-like FMN-containing flavoprotein (pyridoxamine 5'-phosphate oxidase superfamily)